MFVLYPVLEGEEVAAFIDGYSNDFQHRREALLRLRGDELFIGLPGLVATGIFFEPALKSLPTLASGEKPIGLDHLTNMALLTAFCQTDRVVSLDAVSILAVAWRATWRTQVFLPSLASPHP